MTLNNQKSINKTICFSGILFCFLCIMHFCTTDKIDEETTTHSEQGNGVISFKSTATEFNNGLPNDAPPIKQLQCIPAKWGQVSVDVSRIEVTRSSKGKPIHSVPDLADAGVLAYASSGNFESSSSTGITPNLVYNRQLTQTAGVWNYSPKIYWPLGADTKSSFFAYSPFANGTNGLTVSASSVKGTPYVSYSMPSSVENQPDLLVAHQSNKVMADGAINFGFQHAFAFIGFSIQGDGQQIKSIGIKGISTTGDVSLDESTISWSNLGTASTTASLAGINYDAGQSYLTASLSQIPSETLMHTNGYLMVIPQTLTSSSRIVVTLNNNTTREVAINNGSAAWVAGNKYIYNIIFTTSYAASNCFIIGPGSSSSRTVLIDAITRVNEFWADAAGGGFNSANGDGYTALGNNSSNAIASTDQWYFEVIWAGFAEYTNVNIVQQGAANGVFGTGTLEKLQITLAAGTYSGNMVIGVKKVGNANLLWSFHLWITTFDPTLSTNQVKMPSGLNIMDRNLGATAGGTTASTAALGLFYQWGRKDPSPGGSYYQYGLTATPVIGSMIYSDYASNLIGTVYNPTTIFIGLATPYDPIGSGLLSLNSGYNRWGGNVSMTSGVPNKSPKTIYDPCPIGWRVPWGDNWSGLERDFLFNPPANFIWSSYGRLYTESTPNAFFPATGYRMGMWTNVYVGIGNTGMYWGATSTSQGTGQTLFFTDTNKNGGSAKGYHRTSSCAIRPALDK